MPLMRSGKLTAPSWRCVAPESAMITLRGIISQWVRIRDMRSYGGDVPKLFTAGKRAARMRRSTMRRSRSISSSWQGAKGSGHDRDLRGFRGNLVMAGWSARATGALRRTRALVIYPMKPALI
jgi:hypothetical protein